MKTLGLLTFAALTLGILATDAEAAPAPTPALKSLAVVSPTHLAPTQSEVQRVTVEAEGGTFRLSAKGGEGKLTPVFRVGVISTNKDGMCDGPRPSDCACRDLLSSDAAPVRAGH